MVKSLVRIGFVFGLLFVFASVSLAQQKFVANLSNLQVVPPTASGASAVCRGTLRPTLDFLDFQCVYNNLSGALVETGIHRGASVGQNITPQFLVSTGSSGPSGTLTFGVGVQAAQLLADLRANRWYLTMRTANFPDGEIRGQIHLANGTYNDFDGDGRTDLTVYRNSNRSFYASSSLNNSLFERAIGQPGDSVSLTVDFDGDGRSDFSTAAYATQFVWRIFGSSTNALQETPWGYTGDFFAAGDYDGDGRADLAVYRGGTWIIRESSTGNTRFDYFGQSGDVPAPNDYDGDGKADLAVARSENGQRVWYVRRSSDNQISGVQFGLSSDAFFTGRADYDGDGRADISVIRNESGRRVFYILRSSDAQLQIVPWGLSSDLPKLGDYDGDGKTDLAVTRNFSSGKVFYILQSSNNEPRYETFGLPGDF